MPQIDKLAQQAAVSPELRQQLISEYVHFILACASKATGRRISQSDDEWSIALGAFSEAIDCYDNSKGSFLSHARLVITRRLIDHQRSQLRTREVPVPPEAFSGKDDESPIYRVTRVVDDEPDESLRQELLEVNGLLNEYGFSFLDLAGHTPRKHRPRSECAAAVDTMQEQPLLVDWMRAKRRLPLNRLSEMCCARKKTLSLFRWFVIAATEVLVRGFPSLRRYFESFLREAE